MSLIYRGTTEEFHNFIIERKAKYTHNLTLLDKIAAFSRGFDFFRDPPFAHIHFSPSPREALVYALLDTWKYGGTPILMAADLQAMEGIGINIHPNGSSFVASYGVIPVDLYQLFNFQNPVLARRLVERFEMHDDKLEETILAEFLKEETNVRQIM